MSCDEINAKRPFSGPDESGDSIQPAEKLKCAECAKLYANHRSLRRHLQKCHADKLHLAPSNRDDKVYRFQCDKCNRKFNNLHHFKAHQREMHAIQLNVNCTVCKVQLLKSDLFNHYENVHAIKIEKCTLEFDSVELFTAWKTREENESKSRFIKKCGSHNSKGSSTEYFYCHRSGNYIPEGNGLRHLKIQGSSKINACCPARLKVCVFESSKVFVEYTKTHIGHQKELGHLTLTSAERAEFALKIASKIPLDAILDEVRNSISGELERKHLMTKKDLINIEAAYNLNILQHKNDAISVDAWVKNIQSTCNTVLLYKNQNTSSVYPELSKDDFVLILMNEAQSEILKLYGSKCVCIDGTHGTNGYGFELTTLIVLDDINQGFPCAFLISNRTDTAVLKIFFDLIEKRIGKLGPNVFMSDMAEAYYNAWVQVMATPQHRLFCAWHVDHAWRQNLNKIKGKEKQVQVYKILRTVMQETDKDSFEMIIAEAVKQMEEDEDTADFSKYFKENYMKCAPAWAYCYRLNCGINTNMFLERMHGTLKYLYLHKKHGKRLDKCIHAVMKFVRDKMIDRLLIINKGKVTHKLREIRKRHTTSANMPINNILEENGCYIVQSSRSNDFYSVKENKEVCDCRLKCDECKICIHQYSCTCIDYSVKWNICKHIHLVVKFKVAKAAESCNSNITQADNIEDMIIDMSAAEGDHESNVIICELSKEKEAESFEQRKQILIRQFTELTNKATNEEEMKYLENVVKSAKPGIEAIKSRSSFTKESMESLKSVASNKNVGSQLRLFSIKKRRKVGGGAIKKPSQEELSKISLKLVMDSKR